MCTPKLACMKHTNVWAHTLKTYTHTYVHLYTHPPLYAYTRPAHYNKPYRMAYEKQRAYIDSLAQVFFLH